MTEKNWQQDDYYKGRPDPHDGPAHRQSWERDPNGPRGRGRRTGDPDANRPRGSGGPYGAYRDGGAPGGNPHRLYRNPDRAILAGVCAGIADYFGAKDWHVRGVVIASGIFFSAPTLLLYLALALFLKRRPSGLYRSPEEESFWREVSQKPDETLATLRHRYRTLEERLAGMERYVTSEEYGLNREFRKMDR